jgi:hypothetical protein
MVVRNCNIEHAALSFPEICSCKIYQLLAHGRWFSSALSTTKIGRHDIAEILLKVALSTINKSINQST